MTSATLTPPETTGGVPVRAHGLELLGPLGGSGHAHPPSLVRRGDGQTVQLTPLLYRVLEAVDGRRDYATIAADVSAAIGRTAEAEDVEYLVEHKLRPLGLLQDADGLEPVVQRSNPLLALRWRVAVSNPRTTRRITTPFAVLFRPYVAVPLLVAFAAVSGWVLLHKGLASATHQALYEPGMLLLIFGLTLLSAGFHEFGHAAACRYGGATPGTMGVGLYLVWPAFYTDVTDSYRLDRRGRLRVDAGGLYFNAIFAVLTLGVWAATRWDALLLVVPAQLLQMARQLLPFVRFDGYHILADLTGVPDLFAHIKPTLLSLLPARWRGEPVATPPLKPWVRWVVTAWVLVVVPVLLFALAAMVKVLPRVAATAWDSLGRQWSLLQAAWAGDDLAGAAVRVLAMFTIALPVASMTYLLGRIVRRTARRLWRASADNRVLRVLTVAASLAAVAFMLWAWWPDGQYRPVERNERGTLQQLAARGEPVVITQPTVLTAASGPFTPVAPTFHEVGGPVTVPLPADAAPRPGIVLRPKDPESGLPERVVVIPEPTAGAPPDAWPFPFNPPREPRPWDNQALAVNTVDGSDVYEVAFALVWVTDGAAVDHRNEAYALASCSDCRTVAVAFQVVLTLGDVDVAVPENIAAAVNYQCERCESYAMAVQLVATLTRQPSHAATQQLQAVWRQAEALARVIPRLSIEQAQRRIARLERRILTILVEDGALAVGAGTTTTATEQPGAGAVATPTTATPTPTPTGTATAEPTAEATAAPVTATEEPTTDPVQSTEPSEASSTTETATEPADEPTEAAATETTETPTESP